VTIEQKGVVDLIAISAEGAVAYLIISDHLMWGVGDEEHLLLIQEKINEYLSFIEGGTLIDARPDLIGKRLVLKVIASHEPNKAGFTFYEQLRNVLANAGYPFILEIHPEYLNE